jgi:hypothetical protein
MLGPHRYTGAPKPSIDVASARSLVLRPADVCGIWFDDNLVLLKIHWTYKQIFGHWSRWTGGTLFPPVRPRWEAHRRPKILFQFWINQPIFIILRLQWAGMSDRVLTFAAGVIRIRGIIVTFDWVTEYSPLPQESSESEESLLAMSSTRTSSHGGGASVSRRLGGRRSSSGSSSSFPPAPSIHTQSSSKAPRLWRGIPLGHCCLAYAGDRGCRRSGRRSAWINWRWLPASPASPRSRLIHKKRLFRLIRKILQDILTCLTSDLSA